MQGFVLGITASQLFIPPAPSGFAAGGSGATTVDSFRYDNDVRSTLSAGLPSGLGDGAGCASTTTAYISGFSQANSVRTMSFASNSFSTLVTGLSESARNTLGAFASSTHAYFLGGSFFNGTSTDTWSSVDKFDFSDSSRTTLAVGLSGNRSGLAGFASSTFGYVAGGSTGSFLVATVEKFDFATDSRSGVTGLSANRTRAGAFASSTVGYVCGGDQNGFTQSQVEKYTFATDTKAFGSGISLSRRDPAGFQSDVNGYMCGGSTGAFASPTDRVDKMSFSAETFAALAAGLSTSRSRPACYGAPP
jgi:hypothetical protein